MEFPVVAFSRQGYKIRKVFGYKSTIVYNLFLIIHGLAKIIRTFTVDNCLMSPGA